jgi:hypothetical protein
MFPFDIQGEVTLPRIGPAQVPIFVSQIATAASEERATSIAKTDSVVSFRGGVFRLVGNWNVFTQITHGTVEVIAGEPGVVRYRFTCTELLVITTVFAVIAGIAALHDGFSPLGIAAPIAVWGWSFGMNYLIACVRLPDFIRNAMR